MTLTPIAGADILALDYGYHGYAMSIYFYSYPDSTFHPRDHNGHFWELKGQEFLSGAYD